MSRDVLSQVVTAQRRRCVATVLGPLEQQVRQHMTDEEWETTRKAVLAAIGVFADFTLDAVRASNEGQWVNDEALRLLGEIHSQVSR